MENCVRAREFNSVYVCFFPQKFNFIDARFVAIFVVKLFCAFFSGDWQTKKTIYERLLVRIDRTIRVSVVPAVAAHQEHVTHIRRRVQSDRETQHPMPPALSLSLSNSLPYTHLDRETDSRSK